MNPKVTITSSVANASSNDTRLTVRQVTPHIPTKPAVVVESMILRHEKFDAFDMDNTDFMQVIKGQMGKGRNKINTAWLTAMIVMKCACAFFMDNLFTGMQNSFRNDEFGL